MNTTWTIAEVPWPTDAVGTAHHLRHSGELAWLDGQVAGAPAPSARYSLMCAGPIAVLEQHATQPACVTVDGRTIAQDKNAWALWRSVHRDLPRLDSLPWPLATGWVGYVGFEAARQLERLPASHGPQLGLPLLRVALFDRGVVLDQHRRQAYAVHAPDVAAALGAPATDRDWLTGWTCAARAGGRSAAAPPIVLRPDLSRGQFEHLVRRALEYIAAGDIYQVNLAQRFRLEGIRDALATYAGVRRVNPAPYSALLHWNDGAIASFSPELFVQLRGRDVRTCPIKGTRPRTGQPRKDSQYRQELLASAKEDAELAMIVDLHRNDLGRVCTYGSVQVKNARRVEAHPTVYHTVADVIGHLAAGRDALDLLAACFPAGSISGVPKIRALEIIDELEPVARGVYTGAIGVVGLDGQMTMNVAIRTLQMRGSVATLHVGGGIVADSSPATEYEETLAKARGILAGLGTTHDDSRAVPAEPEVNSLLTIRDP